jgi:ubiquinone/menaquinone biosynthesis C-methylase UbiE
LNPECHFIGVDLSPNMLARAMEHVGAEGLANVELREGDMTHLAMFGNHSVDAVISTLSLHHLPDELNLSRALTEAARILRPGGGVYLIDFGHLRAERSIAFFAGRYADRQPELFTRDFYNSMRAAFPVDAFRRGGEPLLANAHLYTTFLSPYLVAFKSPRRRTSNKLREQIAAIRATLPPFHQADLRDLIRFFRLGGLSSPLLA